LSLRPEALVNLWYSLNILLMLSGSLLVMTVMSSAYATALGHVKFNLALVILRIPSFLLIFQIIK
jgi:hypothetical protein